MRNARLNESQAGIKIARRNINNLRYAYNTTLKVESEEKLKSLLMRVIEESERALSKLNIKQTNKKKIMAFGPISLQQIEGGKSGSSDRFSFLDSNITVDSNSSHEIQKCLLLGRKFVTNLKNVLKSSDITLLT